MKSKFFRFFVRILFYSSCLPSCISTLFTYTHSSRVCIPTFTFHSLSTFLGSILRTILLRTILLLIFNIPLLHRRLQLRLHLIILLLQILHLESSSLMAQSLLLRFIFKIQLCNRLMQNSLFLLSLTWRSLRRTLRSLSATTLLGGSTARRCLSRPPKQAAAF